MMEVKALGYDSPYVQKVIKGVLKALETLSIISFDIKAWGLIRLLRSHLEDKLKEAGK